MNPKPQRIIILGGGLAGSFLASRLLVEGQAVSLIDGQLPGAASQVAAGIFNVITGRYASKNWMAETLLEAWNDFLAQEQFKELQSEVHFCKIYRPFKFIKEYNRWSGRVTRPVYAHLVDFHDKPLFDDRIHNPLGGISILPCGWANISSMLNRLQELMSEFPKFELIKEKILYKNINLNQKTIELSDRTLSFDKIVFCEGFRLKDNPYFSQISILPNKGEIIEIYAPQLKLDIVLSRKVYIVPKGEDRYVVGATYDTDFSELNPTSKGLEELSALLNEVLLVPWKLIDHRAGIRPSSPDRKPILGSHPSYSYVHIFTGLGTKGMLYSPYFSLMMAQHILQAQHSLPTEVCVSRFLGSVQQTVASGQ